ncbi:MAG: type II secretion system F family protein, partial [Stellaceae bacterium]
MTGLTLLLLGAGSFAAMAALVFAFTDAGGGRLGKRALRLKARLHHVVTAADLQLRRDDGNSTALDRLVRRLTPQPERLRQRLARTGRPIGLGTYGIACVVTALVFGIAACVLGLSVPAAFPVGLLAGLWLPHLVVGFLAGGRLKKFGNLLPEAVALMVRSIKSGLPVVEAFQIIGRELPDPVGAEFRQLCDQLRIGQPIDQALLDMARRTGVPEVKFLVSTLAVQRETGGNLAETLENLDNILRRRRQMRLKVKALSSEARASAMIIGSLPFIMSGVL